MKGLLLKDWYLAKKYCKAFLLIALVFGIGSVFESGNIFFVFYPLLLAGMTTVTLISYDEKSKWCAYSDTMPWERKTVVSSKYIFTLGALGAYLFIVTVGQIGQAIYLHTFDGRSFFSLLSLLISIGLFVPSLMLPVIFKYGVEKGRIGYYVIVGAVCGICVSAPLLMDFDGLPEFFLRLHFLQDWGQWMILAGAVMLFLLSWALSIHFYEKREL